MKAGGQRSRWLGLAVATAAVGAVLVPGPALASGGATAAGWAPAVLVTAGTDDAPPDATVKYYIVGQPVNGQREYLYDIATKTLGDGNRYVEIFNLNKDRIQPDSGALTDPTVLQPGWVLQLPPDASGPGVLVGPLPTVVESIPVPARPPVGPRAEPADPGDPAAGLATATSVRIIALLALTALLAFALRALRGGRRAPAPVRADDARAGSPEPDDEHDRGRGRRRGHVRGDVRGGEPEGRTARAGQAGPARGAGSGAAGRAVRRVRQAMTSARAAAGIEPGHPTPGTDAAAPAVRATGPRSDAWSAGQPATGELVLGTAHLGTAHFGTSDVTTGHVTTGHVTTGHVGAPVLGPADAVLPRSALGRPPAPRSPGSRSAGSGPAVSWPAGSWPAESGLAVSGAAESGLAVSGLAVSGPAASRSAGSPDPASRPSTDQPGAHTLQTTVRWSGHEMTVRLAGARVHRGSPPFGWLTASRTPPAPTAVVLGSAAEGQLWVDVAFAPDVVTVGGPAAACEQLAAELAAQLRRAGVDVTAVGTALGRAVPDGCRRVDELAGIDDGSATSLDVVFCAGRHASDSSAVNRMLAGSSRRMVPVIVGSGPRARWSIQIGGPS